ncbi:MAG: amidase [Deltaproteobacteria bacterium]|nr:amidase [Deltaproteobacteria bacterium]
MSELLTSSAFALAGRIRRRELSSLELVDAHIAQIERVNPVLNAVVRDRFAEARVEARRADAGLARGEALAPLHGVPCTIKEAFALTGMPNTSGLLARKGFLATCDAPAVAKLRAAGAIPLGVTNVSELCMWLESNNRVYGRSNNPYDPARTVGGSSGGEGAIVGAAASPFGLGSDVGGSIRLPAFFNGVFGHKPSSGWIDNGGQFPRATGVADRYLTTGPLCRRAMDLAPLLRILGPERELPEPGSVALRGLDVVSVTSGLTRVSPELLDAQARVERALEERGARVRRESIPLLERGMEIWSAMMAEAGGPSFAELLGEGHAIPVAWQLLKLALGRSAHTLPALGLAALEKLPRLLPARSESSLRLGDELRRELTARIGTGVMLYPTYPMTAPRHHQPLLPPIHWGYTAVINVMELPATQVPLGLDAKGLPLGLQVVAAHGADHVSLAVALALEEAFGGWVPPARWT